MTKNLSNLAPPQNIEAEQAVLGAILLDKSVIGQLVEILLPSDFYRDAHMKIFSAMIYLYNAGKPIDLLTLFDYLKTKGNLLEEVGESGYLTYLTELVPSTENVKYYAGLVKNKSKERILCKLFTSLDHGIRSGSINLENAIDQINKTLEKTESVSDSSLKFSEWVDIIGNEEPEIEFLIEDLIPTSCLLILAGKPKTGKSLLALLFSLSIGLGEGIWDKKVIKGGVLFVSTEDGIIRLKKRIWKMLGNPDQYQPNFQFYIGDCHLSDLKTMQELKSNIIKHKPSLVVLDPLVNLIKGKELNSGEDMNEVLRPLQNICKELGTTILVIHHARKSGSEDSLDVIQGSTTISGVADGVMILKNLNSSEYRRATLEVILKDAEITKTTVLKLNEDIRWDIEGEFEEISERSIEDEVIKSLRDEDELTIQNLIQITGYEYKPLYRCLLNLEEDKKVRFEKKGRSHAKVYSLKSDWKAKMESENNDASNCNYTNISYTRNSFSNKYINGK